MIASCQGMCKILKQHQGPGGEIATRTGPQGARRSMCKISGSLSLRHRLNDARV
jgi:hypothetical protein